MRGGRVEVVIFAGFVLEEWAGDEELEYLTWYVRDVIVRVK
jgi:hypothetical protein